MLFGERECVSDTKRSVLFQSVCLRSGGCEKHNTCGNLALSTGTNARVFPCVAPEAVVRSVRNVP
jgi:hypothetical protein